MAETVLAGVLVFMVLGVLFFSFLAADSLHQQSWPYALVASFAALGLGIADRDERS
jgi:hypothetical protein